MSKQIRQGDLLFVETNEDVEGQTVEDGIIARGEATGHHHRVHPDDLRGGHADVYMSEPRDLSMDVKKPTRVTHQEHETVTLDPGKYRVIRQREWSAGEDRRVLD